jgi:hypothetical protein
VKRTVGELATPRVARAITSPGGVLLAGVGMSAAVLTGLPIAVAAGIGVAAWAARVAFALPKRKPRADKVELRGLVHPWRTYVADAKDAAAHFDQAVRATRPGPLRDRLAEVSERMTEGVLECARVARSGQALDGALANIDPSRVQSELDQCRTLPPSPSTDRTRAALEAQLSAAERISRIESDTHARLRLLNAQLDEAVAQAVELSVRGADVSELDQLGLGDNVDNVVGELEALRQGLEEAGGQSGGTSALPAP